MCSVGAPLSFLAVTKINLLAHSLCRMNGLRFFTWTIQLVKQGLTFLPNPKLLQVLSSQIKYRVSLCLSLTYNLVIKPSLYLCKLNYLSLYGFISFYAQLLFLKQLTVLFVAKTMHGFKIIRQPAQERTKLDQSIKEKKLQIFENIW